MDADSIRDVFRALGPVRIRKMFGGQGIYLGEVMFALEAGGELHLKADLETRELFRKLGSRPFAYAGRDGRVSTMSYWLIPESALDDPDEAAQLAGLALEAAHRAKVAGSRKGGKNMPPRGA
jgi:DNA transformation protein and related proteins